MGTAVFGHSYANVGTLSTSYPVAGVACLADANNGASKAWPPYKITAVLFFGVVGSSASQIEFYLSYQDDGEYPIAGPLVADIITCNSQTEGCARYEFGLPLRVNFISSTINGSGNATAMTKKYDQAEEHKIYVFAKTNVGSYTSTVGIIEWESLREG